MSDETKRENGAVPFHVIGSPLSPQPTGPFCQGVAVGRRLFPSGHRGIDPRTGALAVGNVETRVRQTLENIRVLLEAEGSSFDRVTTTFVMVRDLYRHRPLVDTLYREYFGQHRPARTMVEISRLNQDDDVEIEMWASRDPVEVIETDRVPRPSSPFAQAVRDGELLFLSGICPWEHHGDGLEAFERQARVVFEEAGTLLKAGGSDFARVVQSRVFVRDLFRFKDTIDRLYLEYFGSHRPPRTLLEVNRLNRDRPLELELVGLRHEPGVAPPRAIQVQGLPQPDGPCSHGMVGGGVVFLSGIRAVSAGAPGQRDSVERQARQAFENVAAVLKAAGSGLEYVVQNRVYVRDMFSHRPVVNRLCEEYFANGLRPRTILEVNRMGQDSDLEIQMAASAP